MAYARTTLTILQGRLLERVGGHGKFWVTAELTRALNEALAAWQLVTGDFITSEAIAVTAGDETASLKATALAAFRALYDTTILTPTTLKDLDQGSYGWRDDANGTTEMWAASGRDLVWLFPQPDANGTLNVEEYDGGEQLTAGGDFVQLGDEDVNAVLDYAQSLLAFKEGPKEGTDHALALEVLGVAAASRRASWISGQNPYKRMQGSGQQAGETQLDAPSVKGGIHG